jgi:cyanate permease
MLVLAPVAAKLINSWGPARVLTLAGVVIAAGLLFRIVFVDDLWQVIVGSSIVGAGTGIGYAALPSLINANTPQSELAAANGINTLARSLGSTLASAVGGALLTAMTISLAGHELPSLDAYRVLFIICAFAALLASAIGLAISTGITNRASSPLEPAHDPA